MFHSGQVEAGTFVQKVTGAIKTGVILRDVSLEVHGGELSAVLGSKGSGKRALLEVISRRAQGPTRGQILLNGVPMSMRLFQVRSNDFFIFLSSHMFYSYAFYVTGKLWICDAKMRPNSRSNCASNTPLCSSIDHWTKSIAICQICQGETSLGRFGIVTCGQQASGDLDPERIQKIGHRYVVVHLFAVLPT